MFKLIQNTGEVRLVLYLHRCCNG